MKTTLIILALSFLSFVGFAQASVALPDSVLVPATADFTTMPQSLDSYKTKEKQTPVALPDSVLVPATADFTTMPQSLDSYKTIENKDFSCEVPYGAEISNARGVKAAYPDGSFATMLTVEEGKGYNQKRAFDLCRDTARTLQMNGTKVSKVKIDGMDGAMATGELEKLHVTLVVLPARNSQLTCLMLNSDVRSEWADNVLRTLKHK